MRFIKQVERLQKLNKLIRQKNTGTPDELAERLGLKRSQLYEVIELLKTHGAPIEYSRKMCTFYYSKDFDLEINLKIKVLSGKEIRDLYGGIIKKNINKILPSDENGWSKFILPLQTYTSCVCR